MTIFAIKPLDKLAMANYVVAVKFVDGCLNVEKGPLCYIIHFKHILCS